MNTIYKTLLAACFMQTAFCDEPMQDTNDMMIIYRKGELHLLETESGEIIGSINLNLDSQSLGSGKLAATSSGDLFLTDSSRSQPVIYRLAIKGNGGIDLAKFAEGCFPVFVSSAIYYFSLSDIGYRLVKHDDARPDAPEEVQPGPFFPALTFQGAECFGFYDQQDSGLYIFTPSLGLERLVLPSDYIPVGFAGDGLLVCYSNSASGTHYLDRSGKVIKSVKHVKPFEKPLYSEEKSGLLVVNRVFGSGFLKLTESEESYLVHGSSANLIRVGPLSTNSVVIRAAQANQ